MSFPDLLARGAAFLQDHDNMTLIAHADADGICAVAILEETLASMNKQFHTLFLPQVSRLALQHVALEHRGPLVLVDMGSSHLDAVALHFAKQPVLILDHHQCMGSAPHALLVNPFCVQMDGARDVSAAGIALAIAQWLDPELLRLSPVALIGAQADNQEMGAFAGENNRFLARAVATGHVRLRPGAKLYGVERRALVRLVANSHDLRIPGVTGNMRGARAMLLELGIPLLRDGKELLFSDLSPEEQVRLEEALIEASPNPHARIVHYVLLHMPAGPLRDTREAATVLNACGRLGDPHLGVRMLRGDSGAVEHIGDILMRYATAVHEAHTWYARERQKGTAVICDASVVIIRAGSHIPAEVAGTLCSVLTRGGEIPAGTTAICLASAGAGTIKVSARASQAPVDLATLMRDAALRVGGEGGGHAVAAGAVIPAAEEDAFIDDLRKYFHSVKNNDTPEE